MRALTFRVAARRDIVDIALYIARERKAPQAARKVRDTLLAQCERIARTKAQLGRPRGDLREGLRAFPHRPYVIFFHYPGDDVVEIVRVLHGARDIPALFDDE